MKPPPALKPHAAAGLAASLTIACGVALFCGSARDASAGPPPQSIFPQTTSALISQQLDKRIGLSLNNSVLPQVLASIEQQTGVPVRVAGDVYDLLPYGTQTPISATVDNLSLRDALDALCAKLGLQVELRDEWVELVPEPALRRMGRRATLQELRTLDLLSTRKVAPGKDAANVASLAEAIDENLGALDAELKQAGKPPARIVVEFRATEGVDPSATAVRVPRDATLRAALDAIAAQTKLTWYPWGDSVVVLAKRSVIRAQLDRALSLRYDGVDVAQVLADLARQTGVPFAIEPGAVQRVPAEFRIIKLTADAPVRQSLEALQAYTGLGYVVTDDGVYVWNANNTPVSGQRGRVAAILGVDPATQVIVYEDELSPAAREALRAQRRATIEAFERSVAAPSTRPATPE